MKKITLSASAELIEAARRRAWGEHTTLNAEFRRWLADYTLAKQRRGEAMALIRQLRGHVRTGGHQFSRDEMNER
jgi:hypothetical protein